MAQQLNNIEEKQSDDASKVQLDNKNACFANLQQMAFDYVELSKQAKDSLTDEEHKALEELSKDKRIIISKVDKGNSVVI